MIANFYRILDSLDFTHQDSPTAQDSPPANAPLLGSPPDSPRKNPNKSIFIFKDSAEVAAAAEVCRFQKLKNPRFPNVCALNDFRAKRGDDLRSFAFELGELCVNLARFYAHENAILLSPLHSLLYPLPTPKMLQGFTLKRGEKCDFAALEERLVNFGFEKLDIIHAPREFCTHGDIIDVFAPNHASPLRISFFDDEIESIRFFDCASQMSFAEELGEAEIFPALFSLESSEFERLDNLAKNSDFDAFTKDIASLGFWFLDSPLLVRQYGAVLSPGAKAELEEIRGLEFLSEIDFGAFEGLETFEILESYAPIAAESGAIAKLFSLHKNKKRTLLSANDLLLGSLEIPQGVEILKENICLNIITPHELILSLNKPTKPKKKPAQTIRLNELNRGDYVVHSDYGIGIFNGLTQANVLGSVSDFVEICYQNDDKLLLPTHNLHLISKYIADSAGVPQLDRLGKGSFARLKEKIRPKLLEIAQKLIDIAAQRELLEGRVIDTQNVELLVFKEASDFTLTSDQERSIAEIFAELSSGRVMDRLLIGDVGFGKTEVAMNAAFAAFKSGYQSALIVPTTLLSNQHFHTLESRFANFGAKIARLDRFTKHKTQVLAGLKSGEIDIVVGTHALLEAEFKNLALVILDEEHKFGVKQKEKLKEMTFDVHILSMSATPIPRTLNLALSRIKTKSELNEPPSERIAPKTFVKNYSDLLLKDAILRELRRRGQVFYIHNNIASIQSRKNEILRILPNLKIAILHSQVPQNESEKIMLDFANARYDLLLSTSIIESGIHLPNANTIIVDAADCFGVADLHQLRGRIGRGDREGYCYFFVEDKEKITADAKKRLLSLESNSFLGAGGILSFADLEVRGGGNILGEAQSGHIKNIGYGLYLQMLEDAINLLSGKSAPNAQSVDMKLCVSAFLNPTLIPSDSLRLDLYRRLSNARELGEIYDIEREISDRFGRLDGYTLGFLQLMLIKFLANSLGLKSLMNYGEKITIVQKSGEKITLNAPERDDRSVLETLLAHLRGLEKIKNNAANLGQGAP